VGSDVSPSLWLTTAAETDFPRLDGRVLVDVAIVGGGIVGVTTGALLKEAVGEEELDRLAPGNGAIVRIGGRHYALYRADSGELQVPRT
jgi:hypothetical protein